MISAIGKLQPLENFDGCGSFNPEIKSYIEKQFLELCGYLESNKSINTSNKNEEIKLWLIACLAKTLKEQAGLKIPLPKFEK